MEEERPTDETQEAPEHQDDQEITVVGDSGKEIAGSGDDVDPGDSLESDDEAGSVIAEENGVSSKHGRLLAIGVLVIVVLIIIGLFLPPVSLGERLGISGGGEEAVVQAKEAEETVVEEEATGDDAFALSVTGDEKVKSDTVSRTDFLAGEADDELGSGATTMPPNHTLASDVYLIDYKDETPVGSALITIPSTAQPVQTLDMMGWHGDSWSFMPSEVSGSGEQLASLSGPLPMAIALMQTEGPSELEIGAEVLPAHELPPPVLPYLSEITAGTLTLVQQGMLVGDIVEVPSSGYRQYLRATNTGAIVDIQSLSTMLNDPAASEQNIQELLAQAEEGGFDGVNLDYQGVDPDQMDHFTNFVADLSAALESQGLELIVTLETPVMVNGAWDTAGQDWPAIGQIADVVYLQMPLEPAVYGDDGEAAQMVEWAMRNVDRSKLSLLVSVNAIDAVADSKREVESDQAMANFGELSFVKGSSEIEPGESVEVALSGSAGDLEWDPESLTYKYTYEQADQPHSVWLGSEALLTHRSRFTNQLNARGVAVRGLGTLSGGEGYAVALQNLMDDDSEPPQPASAAIVWSVEDDSGGIVASSSGEEPSFAWEDTDAPGDYVISANFAHGDSIASLGEVNVVVKDEPTPTPTPKPTKEVVEETPTAESTAQARTIDPGDADAVANTAANVRSGPGLAYGIIGGLQQGEKISLTGRNKEGTWYQFAFSDDQDGWVFGQLLSINSSVDSSALAVVEVEAPAGSAGGAPAPVAVAPVAGGSFELGGQAFGAPYGQMQFAGMNWIKRQHKWGPGNTGQEVAGVISEAHNAGFKILLSIPGPPYPSGINFDEYVGFLGRVAALPDPPDAIEVWNEQNIDREWPAGQISPQAYVQSMLAPAYNAIKGANAGIMVISGAPAPTGAFGGGCSASGCDDAAYVAGMAAAGAANYMDCIGIHYNEGIISPNQTSGDPRGNSSHYTRYFWGMTNAYYNAFGGSRQLCYTELGYLSPEGYGGLPGGFSWAGNVTVAQQAQWLAEATSLAANSGKVRMLIVWNVDSTTWGNDPQAGYAIIRKDGSCPACGTLSQIMGG